MFEHLFESMLKTGWVLVPLILASILGWALAFHRIGALFRLQKTVTRDALFAILSARNEGRKAMEERLDEVMKFKVPELERFLSTLAILATAAPLMGLLGTVSGMVKTFQIISAFGTGNQALMSDGIAESLMATQNGLLVAFPLLIVHVFLTSKAEAIENTTLSEARTLINRCIGGVA